MKMTRADQEEDFFRLQYILNGNLAPLETAENTGVQNDVRGEVACDSAAFVNNGFSRC